MAVPWTYNVKSAFVRKGATALTVTAIAFSVAVLVLVLGLNALLDETPAVQAEEPTQYTTPPAT